MKKCDIKILSPEIERKKLNSSHLIVGAVCDETVAIPDRDPR